MTETSSTDLVITLTEMGGEARVKDLDLAKALGFKRSLTIRDVIHANAGKLNEFGVLRLSRRTSEAKGGRPTDEYWLNRQQTMFICSRSETPKAFEILASMIRVFDAFLQGKIASPKAEPKTVIEMLMIANEARKWDQMWPHETALAIAGFHRAEKWDGAGRFPQYIADDLKWIYELFSTPAVYQALAAKQAAVAPNARKHQMLTDPAWEAINHQMAMIRSFAMMSGSPKEFREIMLSNYKAAGFQLKMRAS